MTAALSNFDRYLWCGHGIVLGQKELQFEHSALEGRALGPRHHHVEVASVVVVGDRGDAGDGLLHQSLGLLITTPIIINLRRGLFLHLLTFIILLGSPAMMFRDLLLQPEIQNRINNIHLGYGWIL